MSLTKYKILLIDGQIKRIDIILQHVCSDVKIIVIDRDKDTFISLMIKINQMNLKYIESIAILKEEVYDSYNLFNNDTCILKNISIRDPQLYSWCKFINMLNSLKLNYGLINVDFISCNLTNNNDYNYIFNNLQNKLNININASSQIIGANNWILDRGNRNLINIYFTYSINIYPYTFGIKFNLNVTTISNVIIQPSNVSLNLDINPLMTPNVNNYWNMINTISGDLTISGTVNNYYMIDNFIGYSIGNNSFKLTLDGGINWNLLNSPANTQLNNIFCWDISNVLISNINRIYKTSNGGLNWYNVSGNFNSTNIISIGFVDEFGIIACSNNTIYEIINYGLNWNLITTLSYTPTCIHIPTKNIIIIGTSNSYICISVNGGSSFISANANIGSITNVYYANLTRIWITAGSNLYYYNYTTNTFTNVITTLGTLLSIVMINNSTLLVTTNNNNYVLLYNFTSTGRQTYSIGYQLNKLFIKNYALYGITNNNLYRLYLNYPGTLSLIDYNTNNTLTTILNTTNNIILNNLSIINYNLGVIYNPSDINYDTISSSIINITFNPTLMFTTISNTLSITTKFNIVTNQNYILGMNSFWYKVNLLPIFGQSTNLLMLDNNNGFIAGFNGSLNITYNGGITWNQINTNTSSNILNFYAWDISNILIITSNKISITMNLGIDWTDMSGEYINKNIIAGDFIYDTGYIICDDGFLYKTNNYGKYWSRFLNIGNTLYNIKIFDRNNLSIGLNTNIISLLDGGLTTYLNLNLANGTINFIYYISSTELLVVTNNGSLYYINVFFNTNTLITSSYSPSCIIYIKNKKVLISLHGNQYMILNIDNLTFTINNCPTTFSSLSLLNNIVYGHGLDNNFYYLLIGPNGTLNFYNNNNLINTQPFASSVIIPYLYPNNYNLLGVYNDVNYSISSIISFNVDCKLNLTTLSQNILYTTNTILNLTNNNTNINWYPIGNIITNNLLKMLDKNIGYIAGYNSNLAYTFDGGITWNNILINITNLINFYVFDISNILVIGSNKIIRTYNGGLNWYDMSGTYLNKTIICSDFLNDTGFISTSDGYIYQTNNSGLYWYYINNIGLTSSIALYTKNIIFLIRKDGYLFTTYDSFIDSKNMYLGINNILTSKIIILNVCELMVIINNRYLYLCNNTTNSVTDYSVGIPIYSLIQIGQRILLVSGLNSYFIINLNSGVTTKYNIDFEIIVMNKLNNAIYGLTTNNKFYKYDIDIPGNLLIFNDNILLNSTFYTDKLFIDTINNGNYNLYALIEFDNNTTISSNIVTFYKNNDLTISTASGIVKFTPNLLLNITNSTFQFGLNTYWNKLSDIQIPYSINKLQIINDYTIFCSTNIGILTYTLNNGITWSNINTGYVENILSFWVWDISNIIVITTKRIIKTFNNGLSWNDMSGNFILKTYNSAEMYDDVGYIVTSDNFLLKTVNYGNYWTIINNNISSKNINLYNKNFITISTPNSYILQSQNGGNTFTTAQNANIGNITHIITCSFHEVFFIGNYKNLLKYDFYYNGGQTYTFNTGILCMERLSDRLIIGSTINNYFIFNIDTSTINYYYSPVTIIIMKKYKNIIYGVSTDYKLYTFSTFQQGNLKLYNNDILFGEYNNLQRLIIPYLTKDIYNFRTELTFKNITISSNILNINIDPSLQLLTISTLLYSSNNIVLNVSSNYNYIIDKTSFWNKINNNKLVGCVNLMRFLDENTIITIGHHGIVNYSYDAGYNWSYFNYGLNTSIVNFYAWDISNILIFTPNKILKTSNKGLSWYDTSGYFVNNGIVDADIIDDVGYIVTWEGNIFKTINYGDNWSLIYNIGGGVMSFSLYNKNIFIIGKANALVYYTYNGGLTFSNYNSGVGAFTKLSLLSPTEFILVSLFGRVMIGNLFTSSNFTVLYTFPITSIESLNTREILFSTYANQMYVLNLNTNTSYSFPPNIQIITMKRYNNSVYCINDNNDFYKIDTRIPDIINIYDNDILLKQQKLIDNKLILNDLQSKNYNFSILLNTISSKILPINLIENYTISSSILYGSNIKLSINSSYNYQINKSSFWNLLNNNSIIGNPLIFKVISNNIFYVSSHGGIMSYTFDAGLNWNLLIKNNTLNIINFRIIDISNIIVLFSNKISKTFDGGNNWFDISNTPFSNKIINTGDFIDETIILGTLDGYIYKTVDNGNLWSQLSYISNVQINNLSMYNKNIFAFNGNNNYIYITRDNGNTYFSQSIGLINKITFNHLYKFYLIVNNGNLYEMSYWGLVGQTVDNIQAFILIDSTTLLFSKYTCQYGIVNLITNVITIYDSPVPFILFTQYQNVIYGISNNYKIYKIHTKNPNLINIYDNNTLLNTFTYNDHINICNLNSKQYNLIGYINTISSNILNIDSRINLNITTISNVINSTVMKINLFGNTNYIYDQTTFWYRINQTKVPQVNNIKMLNESIMFLCGDNGLLNFTIDSGLNWMQINTSVTNNILNLQVWDISNILIITTNNIKRTFNGGLIWYDMSGQYLGKTIRCCEIIDDTGYIISSDGYIYKTINNGFYWSQINYQNITPTIIKMLNKNIIIIGASNSNIYFSIDGGLTYVTTTINNGSIYDIVLLNLNQALLISDSRRLGTLNPYYNSYTTIISTLSFLNCSILLNNNEALLSVMNNTYMIWNFNLNTYKNYVSPTTFQKFYKINNTIYGIGIDNYLYKLDLKLNKPINIYNNNQLLTNTLYNDYIILSNLKMNNYNLYALINDTSSNILTFNVNAINTINTTSGLINFGTNLDFTFNSSIKYNYDSTTYWYKYSNNKLDNIITKIQRINKDYLYALGTNGSLNITLNNGVDWTKLNSPTQNTIYGLQFIDISNITIISANKISRTNNYGISWYDISGLNVNITCADVINEIAYIGTDNGNIYSTFNYGTSWSLVSSLGSKIYAIQLLSKISYVALYNPGYIVVSLNSGITNTTRYLGSNTLIYLSVFDINSIYVADLNYCYIHNYDTNTTTQINTTANAFISNIIGISKTNVLVLSLNHTYSILSTTINNRYFYDFKFYYGVLLNNSIYAISYDNYVYRYDVSLPSILTIYDNQNIIYYDQTSIKKISLPMENRIYNFNYILTLYDISYYLLNRQFLNITTSGYTPIPIYTYFNLSKVNTSIYKSDLFANVNITPFYKEINDTNNYFNVSMFDISNGVASNYSMGILITNNAGQSWTYLGNNVGNIITAVFMVSLNELYATTNDGSVLYSSNNGASWSTSYRIKDIYFSNLYFKTRNVGVITGYTNTVLITKDAGLTFSNAYPGINSYYDQGFISLSDVIFLVGTNRAIVKSSDYGITWNPLNTNLGSITNDVIHFYSIYMFNLNIGFVVGEKGCVLKTINGGVSWTYNSITDNDLKSVIMINQNNIMTVGANGCIFMSKDSGNKWSQIPSGTTQNLNYINIINNTIRICGNNFIAKLNYNNNNIYLPIGTLNITSIIPYQPKFNLFDVATGMLLWLDANDITTLILNNNLLIQWNDKSGFNRNATKYGTDNSYPTYVSNGFNNLPGIQFN